MANGTWNIRTIGLGVLFGLVLGGGLWWLTSDRKASSGGAPKAAGRGAAAAAREAKLSVDLSGLTITGISNGQLQAQNSVVITNPLSSPLTVNALTFAVQVAGQQAASGRYARAVRLPPGGKATVQIPLSLSEAVLDRANDRAASRGEDSVSYQFIHEVETREPLGGATSFDFNIPATLPLFWAPKIAYGNADLKDFGLKGTRMDLTLQVRNPNPFTVRLENVRYHLVIDEQHTLDGALPETLVLPAGGTVPVPMRLDLKTGKALEMGWNMLFKRRDTKFTMTFRGHLRSANRMLRNVEVIRRDSGTLRDLMRTLK